jgi:transcription elongation factor GreA
MYNTFLRIKHVGKNMRTIKKKVINPKKQLHPIPFTKEGLEDIKKKYKELQDARPEAVNNLTKSRELGDLSENGFYKAARARLSSIDNQLFRYEMMIKLAVVDEDAPKDVIVLGSKVVVHDGSAEREFQIVGNYEADPASGKITTNSPIGKALVGRKIGEKVKVSIPSGYLDLQIIKLV